MSISRGLVKLISIRDSLSDLISKEHTYTRVWKSAPCKKIFKKYRFLSNFVYLYRQETGSIDCLYIDQLGSRDRVE